MNTLPVFIDVEAQQTAVIHLTVPRADITKVMGPAIAELIAVITRQGAQPSGPLYSYHWQPPTDTFDFEVGFPVSQPIQPTGRVTMSGLPAGRVATTTYQGGYDGLPDAWGTFCRWLENESASCSQASWESYLIGPESVERAEQFQTQLFKQLV